MTGIPLVALVGNPNAGKSALFNALTGARQKVGNYPGVTVERHAGRMTLADGRPIELIDLPGAYSLDPSSPDEQVTRDVVIGEVSSVGITIREGLTGSERVVRSAGAFLNEGDEVIPRRMSEDSDS